MSNLSALAAISILIFWFGFAIYSMRPDATEPEPTPIETTPVQSRPIHGNDCAVSTWTDLDPHGMTYVFQDDNGATAIMPNAEFAIRSLIASDLLTSVVVSLGYEPNAIVKELTR